MNKLEAEKHLREIEGMALQPYTEEAWWYGIGVKFQRCAKRDGADIKKGSTWGKLIYSLWETGQNISLDEAIEFGLTPIAIREAKRKMLDKCICAICGKEGTNEEHNWGRLRYQENKMDICPKCIREIYRKSHRPWENN